MPKAFTILILFMLSQGAFSMSAEERAKKLEELKNPENESYGTYEERDDGDGLGKVMEQFPEAKQRQGQCKAFKDQGQLGATSVAECIWNGATNLLGPMSDKKKEEIQNFMASKGPEGSEKSTDFDRVDLANFRQKKTKSMDKLEEYLQKRLNESLYGDAGGKGNIKAAADHQVFHRIYQSQIGKNVINSLSSFCLEVEVTSNKGKTTRGQTYNKLKIPSDTKATREKNLKALAEAGSGEGPKAFDHFNDCIVNVAPNCENGADDKDTQNKACEVLRFIKSMKIALKEVEGIQEQWEKRANQGGGGFASVGAQVKQDVDVDKIVNVTSNEVYDKSGIGDVAKEEAQMLEKCKTDYQSNKAECDKYVIDEEKSDEMMDEFELRNIAMADKVKKSIGDQAPNKDGIKKYLEELGYDEDKIGSILGDPEELKKVHKMIKDRFQNEKDAVVALMKEKMHSKSIDMSKIAKDPTLAASKFDELKKEMEDTPERYKELIHYSNVVGAFLKVEGADGKSGKNTKALKAELADSAYAPGGRTVASGNGQQPSGIQLGNDHLQKLEKMAPTTGSDGDTTNLSSGTLDDLIQLDKKN